MSDFLKDASGMNTESTEDYKNLFEQHLASELTKNTAQILSTLAENPNPMPQRIMQSAVEAGLGISLEANVEDTTVLLAQFLDNSNQQHGNIVLTRTQTQEETGRKFSVDENTFENLKGLILDHDICEQNVKSQLGHAI